MDVEHYDFFMDFTNKNVLITGASKGIGRAVAIAFSRKRAKTGINYKSDDRAAHKTLSLLHGNGHKLFKNDICNEEETKLLVDNFIHCYGQIDVLVNNAGIAYFHEVDKVNFADWKNSWKNIIDTNLTATANTCYWAAQHMIKNKSGKIVNVSSRGAFRGEPRMPAYGASKAGINSLSQSLAKALGKYNISVTAVAPGFTATNMGLSTLSETEKQSIMQESPFQRLATPEEIAHAVLFLASDQAVFTSGAILDINGASYLRS